MGVVLAHAVAGFATHRAAESNRTDHAFGHLFKRHPDIGLEIIAVTVILDRCLPRFVAFRGRLCPLAEQLIEKLAETRAGKGEVFGASAAAGLNIVIAAK